MDSFESNLMLAPTLKFMVNWRLRVGGFASGSTMAKAVAC